MVLQKKNLMGGEKEERNIEMFLATHRIFSISYIQYISVSTIYYYVIYYKIQILIASFWSSPLRIISIKYDKFSKTFNLTTIFRRKGQHKYILHN